MKLDLLKDKKDFIAKVLLGVSVLFGVLILIQVTGFFVASAGTKRLVEKAVAQSQPDANQMEKYFARSRKIADELKKKNLFAPPLPKQKPIVSGILGDEVLINSKWYKVGDKVQDAKIVAIEAAQVRIEWQGKEITLAPIDAASPSGPPAPRRAKTDVKPKSEPVETVQVGGRTRPMSGFRGGGMFRDLSPEDRAALRQRLQNMSDEERQKFRTEMRERFNDR